MMTVVGCGEGRITWDDRRLYFFCPVLPLQVSYTGWHPGIEKGSFRDVREQEMLKSAMERKPEKGIILALKDYRAGMLTTIFTSHEAIEDILPVTSPQFSYYSK